MTFGPWLGAAAISAALPALMAASTACVRRGRWRAESARKFLHVALGLLGLSLPWSVGAPAAVATLSALATLWFVLVRRVNAFKALFADGVHAVQRPSLGEFYFTASVWLLYLAARGPLDYCLPLATLVFADTAAALVGSRRGVVRHRLGASGKTLEGSLAFFATALLIALAALRLASVQLPLPPVALALLIALDATLLEFCGRRGSDNLLIPLGVLALLVALDYSVGATLVGHLVIGVAACAARRSSLSAVLQP